MNIQQILKISADKLRQKNIPSTALDAEVLLLEALSKCADEIPPAPFLKGGVLANDAPRNDNKRLDKNWLYINNNYELNKKEEELFNNFINQRLKHKPVAYIVNRKEFYGYDFYVDENVLIPRPETELIVEEVLKILNNDRREQACLFPTIIDIGTGSGCIIISILNELAKNKKDKIIHNAYANDISSEAISTAKINAKKYNLNKKIKFIRNDFEKFLNKKSIYNSNEIIITANLPYVKNDAYKTLSEDIRKYEPKIALTAGRDGLVCIESLVKSVLKIKKKYKQKIYIFIEADPDQMSRIMAISREKLANVNLEIIKDLSGKKRIIKLLYCHPELVEGWKAR